MVGVSISAFGILFSPLLMAWGVSSKKVAWIFGLHGVVWNSSIIFLGPLCAEFGWRKVAIAGGISNFFAFFLSIFAANANVLLVTYSILGGKLNLGQRAIEKKSITSAF